MSAPQPLVVGYILRRFPQLSASFVRNEIRMLEARGLTVIVFAVERPRLIDTAYEELVTDGDRTRPVFTVDALSKRALIEAALKTLRRHPLRLIRTAFRISRARSAEARGSLGKALMVAEAISATRLDRIHAHLRVGSDTAWLVHCLTGAQFSFTAHAYDIYVGNLHLRQKLADASLVVTVCAYNRARLIDVYPSAEGKIHVMLPFLDRRLFMTAGRPVIRDDGPLRLLSVCRLIAKKGVHVLINAMAQVRLKGIPATLTIVGDGMERENLRAQIDELGLAATVSLAGPRKPAEVFELMAKAHCFVLASVPTPEGDSDATPTSIGEAMTHGLPILSTRIAGIPEIVPHDAGLLVEPDAADSLAEAISALAHMHPAERAQMGMRGREFAEAAWNPERNVDRLIELFRKAPQA